MVSLRKNSENQTIAKLAADMRRLDREDRVRRDHEMDRRSGGLTIEYRKASQNA